MRSAVASYLWVSNTLETHTLNREIPAIPNELENSINLCSSQLTKRLPIRSRFAEWPRFSSFLVLLLSSGLTWVVSHFSKWLPGSDGRFGSSAYPLHRDPSHANCSVWAACVEEKSVLHPDEAPPSLPRRPRRYFVPALVLCLVIRLELFHRVAAQIQCSAPGVEVSRVESRCVAPP